MMVVLSRVGGKVGEGAVLVAHRELHDVVVDGPVLVVDDVELVLVVRLLEEATVHEGSAGADLDLDLVALLALDLPLRDEELRTDLLEVAVELLALVEAGGGLVVTLAVREVVRVYAGVGVSGFHLTAVGRVVALLEEGDGGLDRSVAVRIVAEVGLLLQGEDLLLLRGGRDDLLLLGVDDLEELDTSPGGLVRLLLQEVVLGRLLTGPLLLLLLPPLAALLEHRRSRPAR